MGTHSDLCAITKHIGNDHVQMSYLVSKSLRFTFKIGTAHAKKHIMMVSLHIKVLARKLGLECLVHSVIIGTIQLCAGILPALEQIGM